MSDFWTAETAYTFWDRLFLGGKTWPGLAIVEPQQNRAISVAKRRGREPTLTDNGYDPGQIKVTVKAWTEEQWSELQNLIPEFSPRKNETVRTPLEIWHPATDVLGIDAVVITSVSMKHPSDQILLVEMNLLQWFPETSRRPIGRSDGGTLNQQDFEVPPPSPETNL